MAEPCRQYGISRTCVLKWLERKKELGLRGLRGMSRRPGGNSRAIDEKIEQLIVRMEQNEFERAFGNLPRIQDGALRTVAQLGGAETNSAPFLEQAEIRNHSTATKSLQRLCQLGILINKDGVYEFTNPFFRHWLVRLP